jgi:hypothetical protein
MKKILQIFTLVYISLLFTSCGTTYRIEKTEYDYIPYNGNEVLVFESNNYETDTIILKQYKGWDKPSRYPYRVTFEKYEKFGIELIHSNSLLNNSAPDFLIELRAFNWKGLRIDLRTKSKNDNYINKTRLTKAEFDNIPSNEILINEKLYSDVKIILGDIPKNGTIEVTQFYWSKKYGLLGWDMNNSKWRLR